MNDTERLQRALEGLGLSTKQAEIGAAGRNPPRPAGFDGMVATGRALGLSESQARIFAVGRDATESEARRGFDAVERRSASTRKSQRPASTRKSSSPAATSRSSRVTVQERGRATFVDGTRVR